MGEPLNASGDLLPPRPMYDACRVFATYVRWNGGLEWDFSPAIDAAIPPEFAQLIETYLTSVLSSDARHKGWKIPETTLVFPWICRLFPAAKYVFWIRDPRDAILGYHLTDDLRDFGVDYAETDDERIRRAISWKYQFDLVQATPRPDNWIEVRFEDFVLNQEETLARLADFLGFELAQIPVRPQSVGRWQMAEGTTSFGFLAPAMHEYRYFNPDQSVARKEEI